MSDHSLIPVFRPSFDDKEIAAVTDVLKSGWIGLGPQTAAFERAFADYIGVPHVVSLNSGTAALHLACIALGLKPGDEVIVPAMTFAATAVAPLYVGATPVFADVEEDTLTLDPEDVRQKITMRTRAIIPVHYGGTPADMERLMTIATEANIPVIEDAAHACGSSYQGKRIGTHGNLTCYSFHAVKNLAMGDGGMIIPRSEEEALMLKRLRWVGIDKDTWARENRNDARYDWYYEIKEVGYKYHPNDISSALGLIQLAKLEAGNAKRREIASAYRNELKKYPWVKLLQLRPDSVTSQHNFVIRVPEREPLRQFLAHRLISTGVHYMPLTKHPLFEPYTVSLPVTDRVAEEILSLPIYPDLTKEDFTRIIQAFADFDKKFLPKFVSTKTQKRKRVPKAHATSATAEKTDRRI
ncbi:MAG: DegT/DnrJ/EryC1/StrS family aminotransferase [Candidatus Andersenbacteria bacterium]|nr:DegT/DnrJ/EryC1/StrS family aminotransferase [Candidatus Andersenbacteria bacterium]MBI3250250.1 DegT/DnrJ/EryC1/StrS family aminotransferase [Candidatus Andersenbacteria bacterium]